MARSPKLPSEQVILSAPMSFTGSTLRAAPLFGRGRAWWSRTLWVTLAATALLTWWAAIVCWYGLFGVLLVPYRVLRRGARRRRMQELRHREMLTRLGA